MVIDVLIGSDWSTYSKSLEYYSFEQGRILQNLFRDHPQLRLDDVCRRTGEKCFCSKISEWQPISQVNFSVSQ